LAIFVIIDGPLAAELTPDAGTHSAAANAPTST
jgi:hypothetical protein